MVDRYLGLPLITIVFCAASAPIYLHTGPFGQAFESRCGITRAECEGQHFSACQSRLPAGECVEQVVTADVCKKAGCGFIQDFDHPVGEARVFAPDASRCALPHVLSFHLVISPDTHVRRIHLNIVLLPRIFTVLLLCTSLSLGSFQGRFLFLSGLFACSKTQSCSCMLS